MSNPYLGQLMLVGFAFNPRGWANCDGQLLPIAQYQALFSLFGTMYGGDGRTTFGLPGLRGRVAIHVGQGPGLPNYMQGTRSGQTTVVLTDQELPSHNHNLAGNATATVNARTEAAGTTVPTDAFIGAHESYVAGQTAGNTTLHSATASLAGSTQNNGGSRDHQNMQPFQVLRYVVALDGVFPSRN